MRFIEPNRLTATGMSKPVGRSNSSAGPPPGDFDTRSVTARDLEIRAHRLGDPRQLALLVERGDEVVQIFEHHRYASLPIASPRICRRLGRERQRAPAGGAVDQRRPPVAHRADEVRQLPASGSSRSTGIAPPSIAGRAPSR